MYCLDPIADYLTRIRNALTAKLDYVSVPYSKIKNDITAILLEEGYIEEFKKQEDGNHKKIVIKLKYGPRFSRVITNLKRISKPGLRVYCGHEDLPRVLGGLGIAIVSTSKGVVTDKVARKNKIGGEVLAYVW